MKIEYKNIGYYRDTSDNFFGIYISRNEILKNYEKDKELFYDKIITLTEMITTPHCFNTNYWNLEDYSVDEEQFDNFIKSVKKTTTKGVLLYVDFDYDDNANFIVGIIKKNKKK